VLSACADLGYYLHSVDGHFDIIGRRQSIDELLENQRVEEKLAQRLRLVQEIREFAFSKLELPESGSYSDYADLQRPYVLKNLFAAAEFSVSAKKWCYPVVGCAGYRGFFNEQRLQEFVTGLKADNYDVYVAWVSAYSTLGWFDDPVLNTFVHWPETRLAGLIFHELTHQLLYIDGDSRFNESFATAVQQIGVELWLQHQDRQADLQRYREQLQNRSKVFALIHAARADLDRLYREDIAVDEMRQRKGVRLQALRQDYQELTTSFAEPEGFARWFAGELNNAKLLSVSTYHDWVPVFRWLYQQQGGDIAAFYHQVEELGELDVAQRKSCFAAWRLQQATLDGREFCRG
jgi:predicted aminopeptidase